MPDSPLDGGVSCSRGSGQCVRASCRHWWLACFMVNWVPVHHGGGQRINSFPQCPCEKGWKQTDH